jgi:hypothetical protein
VTNACRSSFEQRVRAALGDAERRIPVVLGLCGTGRTTLLHHVQADLGTAASQYVNVERTATTPERFLRALTAYSPFAAPAAPPAATTPRQAFDAVLGYLAGARRIDGAPATFLLDEVLEFRTFESFPGLRRALPEVLGVLAQSPNRFVLTSRYVTRSERALANGPAQFQLMGIQGMSVEEVGEMLGGPVTDVPNADGGQAAAQYTIATDLVGLTGGRPAYTRALVETMASANGNGPGEPVTALATALAPNGRLSSLCSHSYELRLHRARGYGALKAILDILAETEPLTLTEISLRLGRTPGSTKDYLSWLDDVDLVSVARKRYRFRDPLLRVWCRLHCRPQEPDAAEVAAEVAAYATACLPVSKEPAA